MIGSERAHVARECSGRFPNAGNRGHSESPVRAGKTSPGVKSLHVELRHRKSVHSGGVTG
eukprot:11427551-Alexandrium_andersonii.AAC.1